MFLKHILLENVALGAIETGKFNCKRVNMKVIFIYSVYVVKLKGRGLLRSSTRIETLTLRDWKELDV